MHSVRTRDRQQTDSSLWYKKIQEYTVRARQFWQPANPTTQSYLWVYRSNALSAVTLARPSVSSSLQITNRSFRYASPLLWNQFPSSFRQPHSIFTLLLVHLILCILHITSSRSPHPRTHHLSLPRPFTPDIKLISFTNPFLHSLSGSFGAAFTDLNLYRTK